MRRIAPLVAVAGLAVVAVAGMTLRDRFVPAGAAVSPSAPPPPVEARPPLAAEPAAPLPPAVARVRPVAPDIVATPPVDHASLERVESRRPLSEIGAARSPSEGPPAQTILFRPVATGGGAFAALGYEVELAGIIPTAADESCTSDGVSWPCGIHARTAFRNWLRGRALTCVVPPAPTGDVVVSACLLGTQDAAAWLVSHGWAKAEPGGAYTELGNKARAGRRGIFGTAPAVPVAVDSSLLDTEAASAIERAPNVAEPGGSEAAPFVSEPLPEILRLSGG